MQLYVTLSVDGFCELLSVNIAFARGLIRQVSKGTLCSMETLLRPHELPSIDLSDSDSDDGDGSGPLFFVPCRALSWRLSLTEGGMGACARAG